MCEAVLHWLISSLGLDNTGFIFGFLIVFVFGGLFLALFLIGVYHL